MTLQPQKTHLPQKIPFWRLRQTRLIYLLLLVSILPLGVAGWINLTQTRETLQQQTFEKLVTARHLKAEQVEAFFQWTTEDMVLMSHSPIMVQALTDFSGEQNLAEVRAWYQGQPEIMDSGNDSAYDVAHRQFHPLFSEIVETKGYDDIYLINSAGNIVYNYDKGDDFATNLLTGVYRYSHLAQLFNDLYTSSDDSEIKITDFAFYDPAGETAAGFVGAPIMANGANIGVLVFQLSLARINELMHPELDEIGETGEIYLVGPDNLMRSNSRLSDSSTILRQEVDNQAVREALYGNTGQTQLIGYRGEPTLIAYRPLNVGDQTWAMLAEMSQAEAFSPANRLRNSGVATLAGAILLVVVVGFLVARQLNRPIVNLTETAMAITAGNLDLRAEASSRDEVGLLAEAFNSMTNQFQAVINTLEERVTERTEQITALVEVGQQFVEILDLNQLLYQVVAQIKERFNFDHVHVYLLDSETNNLIMAEGDGPVGIEMKRQGYSIPLSSPRSPLARSARDQQVIAIDNVKQSPFWLPHPLLPDIQAELVVPIAFGAEVIGVLDVQSETAGSFTDLDRLILELLTNQVATAVRNARLFSETQSALSAAQRVQRMYTSQSWGQLSGTGRTNNYEHRKPHLPPLDQITTPEALTALQQKQTVTFATNMQRSETDEQFISREFDRRSTPKEMAYSVAATPLKLQDEVIGVLGIHSEDPNRVWTDDEIALIEAVTEQMSLAIENARLFERTQRDAWRNRVVSETTAQVWTSGEINAVMQAAVSQLAEKLQASEVVIQLGPEPDPDQEDDHG